MASFVETSLQMCLVKNYVDDIHIYILFFIVYICCCVYYMRENETVSINEMKKASFDKRDLVILHVMMLFFFFLKNGIMLEDLRLLYY